MTADTSINRKTSPQFGAAMLVNALGEGGAQRSALNTASAWPAEDLPCLLLSARGGPYTGELPDHLPRLILNTSWPRPFGVLRFVLSVRRATQASAIRTLFTNGFGMNRTILLARLSRGIRARVVIIERSTLSAVLVERFRSRGVRWFVRLLTRFLYRRADAIVGVSEGVARDLERTLRLPPGSVHTIYNPIDVDRVRDAVEGPVPEELSDRFLGLPRPIILTVGRLVTLKGQADLITAFAALPERQRGSLIILGEGPLRSELVKETEQLGIADRVWMPGFVTNPWWFIGRADLFCLSSHHEGHPRVLLEALACGTPVVSTDCPHGPRETLTGVDAARLTPVADTPALTAAISDLLDERPTVNVDLTRYHPTRIAHQYAALAQE